MTLTLRQLSSRNLSRLTLFLTFLLLVCATAISAASGGPPAKDELTVTALNSNGGIPVSSNGNPAEWFYSYNTSVGQSISDTICANFSLTDNNSTVDSRTFGFNVVGDTGVLGATPTPTTVTVADVLGGTGTQQQVCFALASLNTTTAGDYAVNIQIKVDPPGDANKVHLSHDTIHIHIHIAPSTATTSCFVTDSSFNFLLDCANLAVRSGDTGRFTIQSNKKNIEVSTQPGQFYYNVLWTNGTGGDITVKVVFTRSGVHPHGAQAIHASVFPAFPDFTGFNFDTVNNDIPSGADDVLEGVVVPAGDTLWADYHLEWNGLGGTMPANIGLTCGAANQLFGVTATIYNAADNSLLGTCAAGAVGYKH